MTSIPDKQAEPETVDDIKTILDYHQRTKHLPTQYAAGPESIDWDAQPDPFRRYDGAPLIKLNLDAGNHTQTWAGIWQTDPAISKAIMPTLNCETVGRLLEISLALSAWKQFGTARWSLRVNPSSGNLHPTECYLLCENIAGLDDGLYHYRADEHALELRCAFSEDSKDESFGTPVLLMALSSVHWREAWKYGERAFRYCQHDVGHALATVSYAAAALNWPAEQLSPVAVSDDFLASLIGIDRHDDFVAEDGKAAEHEYPDTLLDLSAGMGSENLDYLSGRLSRGQWQGRANVLDRRHFYEWPVIDRATQLTHINANALPELLKPLASVPQTPLPALGALSDDNAGDIIRNRRSAQGFDAAGGISQQEFFTLLDHCLVRASCPPWNSVPLASGIHLFLFVHKVEGLESGLYALLREPAVLEGLKPQLREQFLWEPVATAPAHIPLYSLLKAGTRRTAMNLSCQQAIAGESAFSLAMLADCSQLGDRPWQYRHLFWQAGALGQVLYLEAEAAALRGTGIGCFYDDMVHQLLGLEGSDWQVLYHFTLGKALLDHRITSWAPYR